MSRTLKFLFSMLAVPLVAAGQFETKTSYYPSSNSAFSKQAASAVDMHTGALNVSVPLGEISMGSAKYPISLSYKATGIKVEEYASSVGLGWNLNVGGYISRAVRGLPDETSNGYCGSNHIGTLMSSVTHNTIEKTYNGEWDGEPDLFYASLPSGSFHFVLKPDGTPLIMDNANFKFLVNPFANYSNMYHSVVGYWEVVDGNGTIYKLGTHLGTEMVRTRIMTQNSQEYTSSWYLVEVSPANTSEKLRIEYTNFGETSQIYHSTLNISGEILTTQFCSGSYGPFTYNENVEVIILNRLLPTRVYSNLEQAKFVYISRADILTEKRLAYIDYYDINNNMISRVGFDMSYVGQGTGELRLQLDEVSRIAPGFGNGAFKIAKFNYSAINLPPRNSPAYDHWGYHNNNTTGTAMYPSADKSPDLTKAMAKVLLSIENATGGKTRFAYELNDYHNGTTNVSVGGLRIAEITEESATEILSSEKYIYADTLTNISYGKVQSINVDYDELVTYIIGWGSSMGYPVPCAMSLHRTYSKGFVSHMDSFNNSLIYSTVIKKARNGSKIRTDFSSYTEYPDIPVVWFDHNGNLTSVGGATATRRPTTAHRNARGQVLAEYYYNNNNTLVKEITYEYDKINAGQVDGMSSTMHYYDVTFGTKYYTTSTYSYLREFLVPKKRTEKDYSATATVQNTTDMYYDNTAHYLPTRIFQTSSDGVVNEKRLAYPHEMVANSADPTGVFQQMVDRNMVNVAIEQASYVGSTLTHRTRTNYSSPFTNMFLPSNVQVYNPVTQQDEISMVYSAYDNAGNLMESYAPGGPKTVNIWSYKGRYLVAEVKNSDLNRVRSIWWTGTVENFGASYPTDAQADLFLRTLRWSEQANGAFVTTYTYRPMVGMISKTDARGIATYNEYDPLHRLKTVRDHNNKIIMSYTYHYKQP